MISDEDKNLPEKRPSVNEGSVPETSEPPKRRRMRVKIRKKIRIKQKPSGKKAFRKAAERAFWIVIILGFVASLIIMVMELDVKDERFKQQQRKKMPAKYSQSPLSSKNSHESIIV